MQFLFLCACDIQFFKKIVRAVGVMALGAACQLCSVGSRGLTRLLKILLKFVTYSGASGRSPAPRALKQKGNR